MCRSRTRLAALAATIAALLAVALVLATSCTEERADLRIYGELDAATLHAIADALPHMPASPWPCVEAIYIGRACDGTHGCYWLDQRSILAMPAAIPHELGHAAAACAGDYDPEHRAPWWRDVDAIR